MLLIQGVEVENLNFYAEGRLIPNFFIFDIRVLGLTPNISAAPFFPLTFQNVSSNTILICFLTKSSSVVNDVETVLIFGTSTINSLPGD